MNLFETEVQTEVLAIQKTDSDFAPLAEKIRPKSLTDVIGQDHLLGENAPVAKFIEAAQHGKIFPSIIFWGSPGTGKTTLAMILAKAVQAEIFTISAIESGVKELREILAQAQKNRRFGKRTVLFIDEIHRFNKAQQDALLHAVERGIITLIGATTENPSFEVNAALLSRARVYRLQSLSADSIKNVIKRAVHEIESQLEREHQHAIYVEIEDIEAIVKLSGGDARTAINAIEAVSSICDIHNGRMSITTQKIEEALQRRIPLYDKKGEGHYNTISAFIKSMRGSDPNAAIFWLAVMLEAGEDPVFIARRILIFASEDVGNSDPQALTIASACFQAVHALGMPEARIPLAQAVTYLASTTKSNSSYKAIDEALADIRNGADTTVPLHLRNAPTKLMKEEGYGIEYQYPHSFEGHFVRENYFPTSFPNKQYYSPVNAGKEIEFRERLNKLWGE